LATVLRPGYVRPALIDFHGHLSPDAAGRIEQIMADNGVEQIVNLSGGSMRRGPEAIAAAKAMSAQLGGRILNFFNPDWTGLGAPGWGEREAARLQLAVDQYGFRGVKISKGLGLGVTDEQDKLVAVDDARLAPLWRQAAALGVPVSIHVADPRAFWQTLSPKNERWDELKAHPYWAYGPIAPEVMARVHPELAVQLAERTKVPSWGEMLQAAERLYRSHPRTTFVAVHFGNAAEDVDYVDALLTRNPNVFIDISARVGEFGRHPAAKLRQFFERHQDRIVFGTDIGISNEGLMLGSNGEVEPTQADVAPFYQAHFRFFETALRGIAHPSPIQGNWTIDAIDLPADVLAKVYRGNALRLLDRAALRQKAAAVPDKPVPQAVVPAPAAT